MEDVLTGCDVIRRHGVLVVRRSRSFANLLILNVAILMLVNSGNWIGANGSMQTTVADVAAAGGAFVGEPPSDAVISSSSNSSSTEERFSDGDSGNRRHCSPEEEYDQDCFNGGTCFAVRLPTGFWSLNCQCPPEYEGRQCEFRRTETRSMRTYTPVNIALISIGAVGCTLIVFMAIVASLYFWRRRKEAMVVTEQTCIKPSQPVSSYIDEKSKN